MSPTQATRPDLHAVVMDVLGELAFMVTDDQSLEPPVGTVWMQGEVTYYGPLAGTVRCWCTRAFAARLSANLLGLEPEDGEAQFAAEDAVREFMNVLCGQLVTKWHGTGTIFNLSIPKVKECLNAPDNVASGPSACRLSIEGEPLLCQHEPAA
jgi:hypothetical protein